MQPPPMPAIPYAVGVAWLEYNDGEMKRLLKLHEPQCEAVQGGPSPCLICISLAALISTNAAERMRWDAAHAARNN